MGFLRSARRRRYDLCALRLTCRSLRDKVQQVFLETAFLELEVDLTLSHLNALIEISKHEDYSAAIKILYFVIDEAWPDYLTEEIEEGQEQDEKDERNYVEQGVGTALLSEALKGFRNLEVVKIEPVNWVSLDTRDRLCSI